MGMKMLDAKSGDWGLDVIVGEIDEVISVWQAKFFIDGVGETQKEQIRESFKQVMKKAGEEGFTVDDSPSTSGRSASRSTSTPTP